MRRVCWVLGLAACERVGFVEGVVPFDVEDAFVIEVEGIDVVRAFGFNTRVACEEVRAYGIGYSGVVDCDLVRAAEGSASAGGDALLAAKTLRLEVGGEAPRASLLACVLDGQQSSPFPELRLYTFTAGTASLSDENFGSALVDLNLTEHAAAEGGATLWGSFRAKRCAP